MADTPTFGRYAEIPYDQMIPEQQDAYRSLIETRGGLPGPTRAGYRRASSTAPSLPSATSASPTSSH